MQSDAKKLRSNVAGGDNHVDSVVVEKDVRVVAGKGVGASGSGDTGGAGVDDAIDLGGSDSYLDQPFIDVMNFSLDIPDPDLGSWDEREGTESRAESSNVPLGNQSANIGKSLP